MVTTALGFLAMSFSRPASDLSLRGFGRGPIRAGEQLAGKASNLSDDLRLFAVTFAAGFLFVSILIG